MALKVAYVDRTGGSDLERERALVEGLGGTFVIRGPADDPGRLVVDADVVLAGEDQVDAAMIGVMERCRAIVCFGIGFDHVDSEAATAAGITVINHPGFCVDEVSNHAVMFLLALARQLVFLDGLLRRRQGWVTEGIGLMPNPTILGKTLGIVGLGNIGRAVARKSAPLGLRLLATDPYIDESVAIEHGATLVPLARLLEESDFVTTHTPLTRETYHLFGEREFRRMRPTAYFINTSRGKVVDEAALLRALDEGWIAGAGLDVFEVEPIEPGNRLLDHPRVLLTPHAAYYSPRAVDEIHERIGRAIGDAVAGRIPFNVANPEVLGRTRIEAASPQDRR